MWLAICCAAASGWLLTAPSGGGHRRVVRQPAPQRRLLEVNVLVESSVPRTAICALAVAVLGWLLLGPLGVPFGTAAGIVLSVWIGRLEPAGVARAREEIRRDLPLAVDLLAACSSVGRSPQDSLSVVGRAVGGSLGNRFEDITARLALGADPAAEWARLATDPLLSQLGRTMQRSAESGAPLAEGLARLAEDRRRERRTHTQLRARSVGVKAAGPLAACFLPAFMLVGIVPTIAGSFERMFG